MTSECNDIFSGDHSCEYELNLTVIMEAETVSETLEINSLLRTADRTIKLHCV
jgi:hypothetical protein